MFPGLDCLFCGIAAVAVWRNALELYVVFFEGITEVCQAFIVQDVELGGMSIALQLLEQCCPCGCDVVGSSCFEGVGKDEVCVVVVKDHDVLVAAG